MIHCTGISPYFCRQTVPQTRTTSAEDTFGKNVDFEFGDAANSFVERQNLTIRTSVKRFARKANAHSRS